MLSVLRSLFAGGPPPPEPEWPAKGIEVSAPPGADDPPAGDSRDQVETEGAQRGFVISYRAHNGEASIRRIIEKSVYRADGHVYLDAYCLERAAPRCFRVDRIRDVYSAATGEFLGDGSAIFKVAAGTPERRSKRWPGTNEVRHGARVLVTLARADGSVERSEVEALRAYVRSRLGAAAHPDDVEAVVRYAEGLVPSYDRFQTSFAEVCECGTEAAAELMFAACDVINADGDAAAVEVELLREMTSFARLYGIEGEIVPR